MKLIFCKPHKSFWMGAAFSGYLRYRGVFIGKEQIDFTISYNEVYDFYDISMFEIVGNIGNPSAHINEAIAVLKNDGACIEVIGTTWRWEGEKQVYGKRIWINAIDE